MTFRANAPVVIIDQSTNLIELRGLRDDDNNGAYPTDAVVTCSLFRVSDDTPFLPLQDVPMPYVAGTKKPNTIYRTATDSAIVFDEASYTVVITITENGAARELHAVATIVPG